MLAGANVAFRVFHGVTLGLAGLKRDWVAIYQKVG